LGWHRNGNEQYEGLEEDFTRAVIQAESRLALPEKLRSTRKGKL
jgi:hypothetical protein